MKESHVSTLSALIPVHCLMLVVKMQSARLKIMLEFVLASLEQPAIHYLDAFNFNTAVETTNVQLEQIATTEYAAQYARTQETVWQIKCVFRACANLLARPTQLVQTSNTARTTFAFKNQNVLSMKTVMLVSNALSTQMEDQSAKMFAVADSYAAGTQSVSLETTMLNANARKDFILMERFVERLNANQTTIAVTTNGVTITCVKLFV